MPVWEYAAGYVLLMLALGAIVLMIYMGCDVAVKESVKELREDAERQAEILAEHKFREMLKSTTFRVHIRTRIIDEMHRDK